MNNLNGLKNNIYFTLFPGQKPAGDGTTPEPAATARPFELDAGEHRTAAPAGARPAAIAPYDSALDGAPAGGTAEMNNLSGYEIPEAGRFENFGRGGAPNFPGAPPPGDYEKAVKKYEEAAAQKVEHQPGWKNAVFVGLQLANKIFNPEDQSPVKWLGQAKHDRRVNEALRGLAPLQALEERKAAQAAAAEQSEKSRAELAGLRERTRGQMIANANEESRRAYETLAQKDYVTPEEAEDFSRSFGIRINPYDARQFALTEKNGLSMATNTRGIPHASVVDGSTITGPVREQLPSEPAAQGENSAAALNYAKTIAQARAAEAEAAARLKNLDLRRLAAGSSGAAGAEDPEQLARETAAAQAQLAAARQILQTPAPGPSGVTAAGSSDHSHTGPVRPAVDRLKLFQ